ncbi:MAG: hypothetical protein H6819_10405 [Phycisphaerales bacterium]|nr:hypothetical protein [Phycisphaerales bacterium]MCB9855961.1 hypothetical protein [Phycisphaerales bacterium]MCB9864058.1 hypothetical protein [Phycisphaerales bacterium]
MILEHDFITTRPEEDAFATIGRLLADLGFKEKRNSDGRDFVRGLKRASAARRPSDLPQTVRVEFDRGRVSLGIVLETHGAIKPAHREMLHTLAVVIENVVSRDVSPDIARRPWDLFEAIHKKRRGFLENVMLVILVLLLLVLLVVAIAVNLGGR